MYECVKKCMLSRDEIDGLRRIVYINEYQIFFMRMFGLCRYLKQGD